MPFVLLALLAALLAPSSPPPSGPTVAIEDTLYTELPEVLVSAPRVTLDEILDRVARGEARRESLLTDQSFTAAIRMVKDVKGGKQPKLFQESVWRVWRKRPDKVRSVLLRRWKDPSLKDGSGVEEGFSPGMGEQIVNFAFRPEVRRDYRYRIVGRDIVGNHLIYRLEFEPRSPLLAYEPSGKVWVDTNDFVIVREEIYFRGSPVPILLKGIDRAVIERTRVREHWVLSRVLMRAELTLPLPKIGQSFDFSIQFLDYTINAGLDDAFFDAAGKSR